MPLPPAARVGAFGNATTAITLGDANTTANHSSPSLLIGGAFTVGRSVTVANQATTGTYTIGGSTDNNATFSGVISINQPLTITQVANTGTNALSLTSGISSANSGTYTLTFAGPGSINATSTAIIANGSGKVNVAVTGGTATLSATNTYTGTTTVMPARSSSTAPSPPEVLCPLRRCVPGWRHHDDRRYRERHRFR